MDPIVLGIFLIVFGGLFALGSDNGGCFMTIAGLGIFITVVGFFGGLLWIFISMF